jgi:hypothetical protein
VTDLGTDAAIAARAATFRDPVEAEQGIAAQRRLRFAQNRYLFLRTGT